MKEEHFAADLDDMANDFIIAYFTFDRAKINAVIL